jgi:hypothetical protein
MGLRISKRIKIAPGVNLNIGKRSAGLSLGSKGLRYTVNSSGRRTTTAGIPGTGIYYSTTSGGKRRSKSHSKYNASKAKAAKLQREKEKAAAEKQKQLDLEYAKAAVEEYEDHINAIRLLHTEHEEPINWKQIYETKEPFSDPSITPGPRETDAREKLDNYKPGFFAKRFKFAENSNQTYYQNLIEKGKKEDREQYNEWKNLHILAEGAINGDTDTMLEIVENMQPFEDLTEFGSGFEMGFLDSDIVEVEFMIMADTVVPAEAKSLTSTGKLSIKPLAKGKRLDIMQDYVCSCILRIAGDLFAILPVNGVLIHAMDTFIDTAVGITDAKDIVSVFIDRSTFNTLNLEAIDPSDSMQNFKCNMTFLKTKGFKPVQRIQ